jgi:hypothetical protein
MTHGREKPSKIRTRLIDVLWKTKRNLAEDEILRLREEEGKTNPDFELRTSASKNVMGRMTQAELKELKEAAEDMERKGYSEEHKRR